MFSILADANVKQGGYIQTLVMIGVFVVVFYFLLWRPDRKRRKEMETKRNALKKGDKVTAMGLIGNVFKVNENTVILKMYDGAKVEILKGAITDVQPGTEECEKEEKTEG
jgi:preprotein translocase subunit YajC